MNGSMKQTVDVAVAGIAGYGAAYVEALLYAPVERGVHLVAGVDPAPERCRHLEKLKAAGIPIYADLEGFYAESWADLVVMATSIHLHAPLTLLALSRGSSVLCEKPLTATIQDANRMAETEAGAQGFAAIGYQWSFSDAIQALKQDVLDGALGRPLRLKTKVFWPRRASYYGRNDWAGKLKTSSGEWVLDSPVNNAVAHYLHNMFYILGETRETSDWPVDVVAELYRANEIESYDAAAIRCHTKNGAELLFYAAHPVVHDIGPSIEYAFENAVVTYERDKDRMLRAHFRDGRTKSYGSPDAGRWNKLWQSVEAVGAGNPIACGIGAAAAHTLCVNGAQESMSEITTFPRALVRKEGEAGDRLTWVDGLQEAFERSYDLDVLPSEDGGFSWARSGELVNLQGYRHSENDLDGVAHK